MARTKSVRRMAGITGAKGPKRQRNVRMTDTAVAMTPAELNREGGVTGAKGRRVQKNRK